MYHINQIKVLHLEISSKCNAACPLCPRNFYGYPYNDGYIEHNMTLLEAKQIFTPEFIAQLNKIHINGNFGDIVMNMEAVDIIKYFRDCSPNCVIKVSTNGSARNKKFWHDLAKLKVQVDFCLDGLDDTHHLYRQNTSYKTIIKNAQTFIQAGGFALWKMIRFDHNKHQEKLAEKTSKSLGFAKFELVDHGRNQGPVFNKHKKLVHILGNPLNVNFNQLYSSRTTDVVLLEDVAETKSPAPISCQAKNGRSIYVTSVGEVYPCCYLGFSPKTYGYGNYHAAVNAQIRPLIYKNNALKYPLADCIAWFSEVEKTWSIDTFEKGRLVICNDVCGKN
jgi:sulfatase maturation enzyme AslB (radical SAM superfamily)